MRRRQVPKEWSDVFGQIFQSENYSGESFSSGSVMALAKSKDLEITKEALRVKLSRYVRRGYLKKVKRDQYGLGPNGYYFFGLLDQELLRVIPERKENQ